MSRALPHQRVPIAEAGGIASNPFYAFLQDVERALQDGTLDVSGLQTQIDAIKAQLAEEDPTIGLLLGQQSIRVIGQLKDGNSFVMLQGDSDTPGPTYAYGTDAAGVKGWHPISAAMLQGTGVVLTVGADGVTTFDLAELTDSGTGTFKLITRDSYGRVSGTADGTTSDVPEGSNLYYTDARAAAAAPIQSIVAGTNVSVDVTDPANPIVSSDSGNSTPPGYIDGLRMEWVSGTSLRVTSGTAYIESTGEPLPAPASITKAGLSLSASTWYHVYLFDNAGTPDIEIVTTAPATAYNGWARSKTGDTSRRYIGSVKTLSTAAIAKFRQSGTRIDYLEDILAAPLFVLSGGTSTTPVNVSLAGAVPVTSKSAGVFLQNSDPARFVYFSNPDANFTLSNADFLAFSLESQTVAITMPTDGSQQITYKFQAAPTGVLYIFVTGYIYER